RQPDMGGAMLSSTQSDSAGLLPAKQSAEATTLRRADLGRDLLLSKRSSITTHAFARFLITFCIGVGVTVACAPVRVSDRGHFQRRALRQSSGTRNSAAGPLTSSSIHSMAVFNQLQPLTRS